ncbi:MAG: TetR/AcrR family transcriptional regulator [Pseudomonadales bacterium]|nr:TetR/AcrR family transcriptional regulator [Pseudomonadales bacterium]
MGSELKLSKSELRNLEFKQRICNAAIALFLETGVKDVSVQEIIKNAGIAHKTFFNHFPTKQHLLSYIASQYTEALFSIEPQKDLSPYQNLEKSFLQSVENIESMDVKGQNMISHILISTPTGPEDLLNKQTRTITEGLTSILKKAEQQNQLQDGFSVDTYTDIVGGILMNIIIRWAGQDGYPLKLKMEAALVFIKRSVFMETEGALVD